MKIRINSKYAKIPTLKKYKNRKIRENHENGTKKKNLQNNQRIEKRNKAEVKVWKNA